MREKVSTTEFAMIILMWLRQQKADGKYPGMNLSAAADALGTTSESVYQQICQDSRLRIQRLSNGQEIVRLSEKTQLS